MTERESRLRDAHGLAGILNEMAGKIAKGRCGEAPLRLVGIRTRGVTIAERLARLLPPLVGDAVPVGAVDITLYRDDLGQGVRWPVLHGTHIPFDVDRWFARHVAFHFVRFVGVHVLTIRTPIGRRVRGSEKKGDPLVRVKPRWLEAAGVERVPRTVGAVDGRPQLEDGRILDVKNVVWCTGFRKDLSWIRLPIFDERGEVRHEIGVSVDEPGLAFVGLPFQYSFASEVLPGMNRDARYVVQHLMERADRSRARTTVAV